MKRLSTIRGIAMGMMVGSAACAAYTMMNPRAQKKLRRMASATARKMTDKVNCWFG